MDSVNTNCPTKHLNHDEHTQSLKLLMNFMFKSRISWKQDSKGSFNKN